jgi:hypothetical protein
MGPMESRKTLSSSCPGSRPAQEAVSSHGLPSRTALTASCFPVPRRAVVLAALPSGFVRLAFGATVQQALRDDRRGWIFNIVMAALLVASVALVIS